MKLIFTIATLMLVFILSWVNPLKRSVHSLESNSAGRILAFRPLILLPTTDTLALVCKAFAGNQFIHRLPIY